MVFLKPIQLDRSLPVRKENPRKLQAPSKLARTSGNFSFFIAAPFVAKPMAQVPPIKREAFSSHRDLAKARKGMVSAASSAE